MEQRNTGVFERKREDTYIVNRWDEQQCCRGDVKHNNESQQNQHPWSVEALLRDKSVKNKSVYEQSADQPVTMPFHRGCEQSGSACVHVRARCGSSGTSYAVWACSRHPFSRGKKFHLIRLYSSIAAFCLLHATRN